MLTGWHKIAIAGVAGFVLFVGYRAYEDWRKPSGPINTQANVVGSSDLTVLTPITTLPAGATDATMVYPISVTDPGALTLADFNYGISTTPDEPGEQGITYAQYQSLVG